MRKLTSPWLLTSTLTLLVACSSDPAANDSKSTGEALEIFSWWTGAGEAEALDALFDVFKEQHPDIVITNAAAADPENARDRLESRMKSGEPPDSFQAISGVGLLSSVDDNRMTPITGLAEKNGWYDVFPAVVLDILSKDGELYGVPVNIERDNNLYYNMAVMEELSLEAPRTLDDFYEVCSAIETANEARADEDPPRDAIAPLAVPAAGWVLALVAFETLMPGVTGGEYYNDFFAGEADPEGPELREFYEELAKVFACSNVATAPAGWGANGDLLYNGEAAMFVMGDWAKGYFQSGKDADQKERPVWEPGVDFGVVPGLGSDGYFTFNSAVFGLPARALHPQAAEEFLKVVASQEGQEAFNPIKGSVPARIDVDLDDFDDMVRGAAEDFKEAAAADNKLLPGYASLTTFAYQKEMNPALLVFAVGGAAARELDTSVPESEESVPALDIDYIVGKTVASYALLEK